MITPCFPSGHFDVVTKAASLQDILMNTKLVPSDRWQSLKSEKRWKITTESNHMDRALLRKQRVPKKKILVELHIYHSHSKKAQKEKKKLKYTDSRSFKN